ncbi:MAG: T9SS type A sorting domain-containing protein [Bacteroidetes bacterium]|nr:T9SS type A sorting domain-containing protein [Bacteroidota bacterium]
MSLFPQCIFKINNKSLPARIQLVWIKVYNILGKEIATLVNEEKKAGNYSVQLSAVSNQLSSGVYFYRMQAGSFVETKKLLFLK